MRRVCVVTGASSGIGRATAIELAERGVSLVLAGRHEGRLEDTAGACRGFGVEARAVAGDIAKSEFCNRLFTSAKDLAQSHGDATQIVAVFAAGTAAFGPTADFPDLAWDNMIEANLTGLFFCCRAAVRAMLEIGGGRIVNVISIAAKQPFPQAAAYVASKQGALGLTHSMANEYRAENIFLTAFVPGSVDTPLWNGMDWTPERTDMLSAKDVASAIADIVTSTLSGVFDEVVFMPNKGIL